MLEQTAEIAVMAMIGGGMMPDFWVIWESAL